MLLDHSAPAARATSDQDHLHRALARFNARRLAPQVPSDVDDWEERQLNELDLRRREHAFVEAERVLVADEAARAPRDAHGFVTWFAGLAERGPGQGDALFPWLAQHATLEQMRWFLTQEAAGEAGFDDLVALSQVKMPDRVKVELARNYWDEMGRGHTQGMHGRLLDELVAHLGLRPEIGTTLWPALALGNLMVAFATDRRYAYHALGALGVIELTAPGRVAQVDAGLRRLGLGAAERRYFELHAVLDLKHSQGWNAEVLAPLIEHAPELAPWLAEGALLRLRAGDQCFRAYRRALWGEGMAAPAP
ncbi:MAG: iron-containing redox enzyme family protein [Planctomycetes bacterium]|nr:iron-containing redox enzyme family protein [Planctomycetota bacterium]